MELKKHKKLFVLFAAIFIFYTIIGGTFSIYREQQDDSINLSILDATGMVAVNFHANGGTIDPDDSSRSVQSGTAVGELPEVTRTNYNFVGWFTDPTNGEEITSSTIVTGTTADYYAHWAKIVCKKAVTGTLHSETCASTGSCAASGGGYSAGDTIYYGTIPGAVSPIVGDAYDCDVNDDGIWNPQTERFYYVRSYGTTDPYKNSVLVHYTSFDEDGQMDSSSTRLNYEYAEVGDYLPGPTKWGWDNPALIEMDGNVTRLISREDITAACGSATGGTKFATCHFFLENSRYQSKSLGRAGIWLLAEGNTHYRIHTETLIIATPEANSKNTVRPTIEIPSDTIEGFKPRQKHTITLDSEGGEPSSYSFYKYDGQQMGELPTPTKEGFVFSGWYTDNQNYTTEITADTVVTADVHGYAKWDPEPEDYAFYIPGECTFTSTGITNGENGNCISTVNPTGSDIDYTQSSLASKKYIDTGIALYDTTNHDKNYEIHFEIVSYNGSQNESQATFFNTKNEATGYPGLVVRRTTNNANQIEFASRRTSSANTSVILSANDITKMSVYRINGKIYYSINDGEKVFVNDLTQYNPVFDLTTWFGGAPTNASATSARRFLTGTLKNIYIKLTDAASTATVTFDPNYQGASTFDQEAIIGQAIGTLPTSTRTGYTFDGWYTDPTDGTKITSSTVINDDIRYYAHWIENITITFNPGEGTVSPTSKTFSPGTAIGELPTPERTGYTFGGWYTYPTSGTEVTASTVFSSTDTIYAHWIENITVTFNPGEGTVSPTSKTFTSGTAIGELPTPERTGYVFDGWYTDPTSGTEVTSSTVFSSTDTIYARWLESITVTFNADGGEVSPSSKTFASGTAIGELPTPTKTGYDFDGWYTDNTWTTEVTEETTFNTTTSIIAKWEESEDITVTFNADGGTVSPSSKTFAPNSAIGELPIPEKTDYVFVGWYTDNTWTTEVTAETTFDTTTSIIARWVDETYVACVGSTCYTTLSAAVNAVPSTGVKTTIKIIQDITTTETTTISSNRWPELDIGTHTIATTAGTTYALFTNYGKLNIINGTLTSTAGYIIDNRSNSTLNISGGTLAYNNSNDSEHKVIEIKGGTVNISGGTLTCNSKAAVINANAGTLNVSGGTIKGSNTFKGQAIYNNGATTTISGTAYLENVSANNTNGRACVHNYSGTVNILGGTIVSKANAAVKNNGTMTIGVSGDSIDTTSPVLRGSTYGLETVAGYTVTIYDGIFKGKGTTADKAISNEAYVDTGTATIVHDTETIDSFQYDVAYLQDSSSNITVNFNVNGGDEVEYNSKTLTESGPIGSLPDATKDGSSFLGWFTSATGGERVLTVTEVDDDITYYAHYTNATTVCRPATTLHTSGQTEFGQIPTGSSLSAGDAYDCDVNGDGTFDSVNERFYYLTDTSNGKAVFIFSNNTSQVNNNATPICSATAVNYAPTFTEGPNTAIGELPTTTQWSNVNIYTEPRTITNQSGTTVLSDYVYTEKAARFATLDEIKAATSSSLNETANELAAYTFLLENTASYGSGCRSNYWLETTNSNGGAVRINGAAAAQSLGHATGSSGVRPVIEVPYDSIDGAINIVEFDTIPAAMRTYFNNVDSWNSGQDDTNYSSFNSSMVANLNNYNCAYYNNDNVNTQYGSVFCDQPNKYDTGATGDINVYEYNEATGVISNTTADYVFNDNGKLYNFIPGKTYYWESDSDSTINGYVRPTGERRLITIPGTTRQTRNVRDLGGLPVDTNGDGTIDGKVKYQKLYRGEKIWGTNRNGTVRAQLEKLGIYNEYDLRTPGSEIVASEEDQLSNYISNEIVHYKIDHTEFGSPASDPRFDGKSYYQLARDAAIDVMQKVVAGNDDYAIYFHCRIGADRTGTLAYLLEGVLGVPTEYRHQDYELTTFFGLRERTRYYYKKDSTNDEYKFIYLKKAIRHATPGNNENTGEENVMDWFLLEGNSTDECSNITTLINQFRAKMIDYN